MLRYDSNGKNLLENKYDWEELLEEEYSASDDDELVDDELLDDPSKMWDWPDSLKDEAP